MTVTTASGGVGSCTVQFRLYVETIGPLKETAVWIEESPMKSLSWGQRRMVTTSYHMQDDPLGLSIEGNDKKFPEDLREVFPEHSGDLSRENFSPYWFLLENHHATSFEDLKAGYSYLKRKVEGQKEGQLSFLKTHVGSVIDQLDTMMKLKDKMDNSGDIEISERVRNLQGTIAKSIKSSHMLFDDVLERRERSDKSRAALSVINRYRFLFCLPTNIERNAINNEFDIIANDYARVKNLYSGKTDIALIKKVLDEIDEIILEVRKTMHGKIQEMPQAVDQQKKIVKCLINLEIQQIGTKQAERLKILDPAWDALFSRARYIEETFRKTFEEFKEKETVKDSKRDLNSPPVRVLFCEEINEIAAGQFPDLWRLGQSYFTGELRGINEPKPGNFKQIILNVVEKFCSYIRSAIFTNYHQKFTSIPSWPSHPTQQAVITVWLPTCLRYIRITYASFIRLDLPNEVLDVISKVIDELRLFCLTTILKKSIDKVKKLVDKEDWEMNVGEFPGATSLPSKLEEIIGEALDEGQQMCLQLETREDPLFMGIHNLEGYQEVSQIIETALLCFSNVIEELATQRSDDEIHQMPIHNIYSGVKAKSADDSKSTASTVRIVWENRLLCCLANAAYCNKSFISSNLGNLFTKYGYPIPKIALEKGRSNMSMVFNNLLEIYVELKNDTIVSTIEPSMYLSEHFSWSTVEKIDKLSYWANECLDNLVGVYLEIYSISPLLLRPILEQIIQTIAEELSRLMNSVKSFNVNGQIQAILDIKMIRDSLRLYNNERAKSSFQEALDAIPKLNSDDHR